MSKKGGKDSEAQDPVDDVESTAPPNTDLEDNDSTIADSQVEDFVLLEFDKLEYDYCLKHWSLAA